jgi:hypothetical protein
LQQTEFAAVKVFSFGSLISLIVIVMSPDQQYRDVTKLTTLNPSTVSWSSWRLLRRTKLGDRVSLLLLARIIVSV